MTTDKSRADALTNEDIEAMAIAHGLYGMRKAVVLCVRDLLAASPVEKHEAVPKHLKVQLRRVMDLLDTHLGDTDPMLEGMTQDEIEEQFPVVAAMQIVVALHQETPDEENAASVS